MQQVRVIAAVALVVVLALVLPNLALRRSERLWTLLAQAEPATDLSAIGRLHTTPAESVDVVVVGSSLAGMNVSERVLQRETGLGVLNIGVLGMPPLASAMYLDEVLALKPQTIVFSTGPLTFAEVELPRSMPFDPDIAWEAYGARGLFRADLMAAALGEVSVLVRLRDAPRLWWQGKLSGTAAHPANLPALGPRRFDVVARNAARKLRTHPTLPDGPVSRALRAYIARADAAGVHVLLVAAPQHPSVFGSEDQFFHPEHLAELRRIADDTPATLLGPDEQPAWRLDQFRDPTHLSRSGQADLTRTIATALR